MLHHGRTCWSFDLNYLWKQTGASHHADPLKHEPLSSSAVQETTSPLSKLDEARETSIRTDPDSSLLTVTTPRPHTRQYILNKFRAEIAPSLEQEQEQERKSQLALEQEQEQVRKSQLALSQARFKIRSHALSEREQAEQDRAQSSAALHKREHAFEQEQVTQSLTKLYQQKYAQEQEQGPLNHLALSQKRHQETEQEHLKYQESLLWSQRDEDS